MPDVYLRTPHLLDDQVVFVADDDVWRTPLDGGVATRLTSDRVPVSRPRLSPDGQHLAWASRRDGEPEVYVAPADGGAPQRLTWWGSPHTRLIGWSDASTVVAAAPSGQPFRTHAWAYGLPLTGEPPQRLPYGPIGGLARSTDGATVLQSVVLRDAPTWKRYRGGTAG